MKKFLLFASAVALFASCSKDVTEDIAPAQIAGKATIYASYEAPQPDAATRTHAEKKMNADGTPADGYDIVWDAGDAFGLFEAEKNSTSNVLFGCTSYDKSTKTGTFVGNIGYLAGTTYVGYYPHEKDRKIDANGNITLTIPATQQYRFPGAGVDSFYGSFAAAMAPAVAVATAPEEGESLTFEFKNAASYVRAPFYGFGNVKSVALKIKDNKTSNYVTLAGDFTKNIEEVSGKLTDEYTWVGTPKDVVVVDCGKNGVDLEMDKTKAKAFWFVIPAGVAFDDVTLEFYVNDEEGTYATPSCEYPIKSAGYRTKLNNVVSLDKAELKWVDDKTYPIFSGEDFLKYAYVATKVENNNDWIWNNDEASTVDKNLLLNEEGKLKPAVVVKSFSMDDVVIPSSYEDVMAMGAFAKAVIVDSYGKTKTISTIGGKQKFEISAKKGVAISNLTVNGPVFNEKQFDGKSSVEGLTFNNVTVVSKDNYFLCYKSNDMLFDDITIGKDCEVEAPAAEAAPAAEKVAPAKAAVLGRAFTNDMKDIKYPETFVFADELNIMDDVTLGTGEGELNVTYNVLVVNNYGTVKNGTIITVADKAAAEALKVTTTPSYSVKWYSVMDKAGTSYWTGTVATSLRNDDVLTAEELAYDVTNFENVDKTITLTNDIDLMGKLWVEGISKSSNGNRLLVKGEDCTISNVVIADAEDAETFRTNYTLFGGGATVQNLTVDGIKITVSKDAKNPVVAALAGGAGQATSSNVNVKGLKITVPEDAENVAYVGGLYAFATSETTLKRIVTNETLTVETPEYNIPESVVCGDIIGQVTLTVSGADNTIYDYKAASEHPFGAVVLNVAETTKKESTKITFTNLTKTQVPEPVFGARQGNGHVVLIYFGEDKTATYMLRDEEIEE